MKILFSVSLSLPLSVYVPRHSNELLETVITFSLAFCNEAEYFMVRTLTKRNEARDTKKGICFLVFSSSEIATNLSFQT